MKKRLLIVVLTLAVLSAIAGAFFAGRASCGTVTAVSGSGITYRDTIPENYFSEKKCYVIGHKSPDTDTVCSAIACAELLNSSLGADCTPVVAGKINNETKFALEYFGVTVPETLTDATGKNMVLVDHSAYTHAIDGMEDATVLGLFDHHGLGDVKTSAPVLIRCVPSGSTATILYMSFAENGIEPAKSTAGLLLSAILSDTMNLVGSTTTQYDRDALSALAKTAGITDINAYYALMQAAAESYDGMTDDEIFLSDFKEYDMSGAKVGIGCVNAKNADAVSELAVKMANGMAAVYDSRDCGHLYAMIYNREAGETTIVYYGEGAEIVLEKAFGTAQCVFNPGIARKTGFVPQLEAAYKELAESRE